MRREEGGAPTARGGTRVSSVAALPLPQARHEVHHPPRGELARPGHKQPDPLRHRGSYLPISPHISSYLPISPDPVRHGGAAQPSSPARQTRPRHGHVTAKTRPPRHGHVTATTRPPHGHVTATTRPHTATTRPRPRHVRDTSATRPHTSATRPRHRPPRLCTSPPAGSGCRSPPCASTSATTGTRSCCRPRAGAAQSAALRSTGRAARRPEEGRRRADAAAAVSPHF